MNLVEGMDFRQPEYRREVFLRFYEFHLRYRSHPGCVYYVIPSLAREFRWRSEEAYWYAFINGLTQNPVTSLILHRRFPRPDKWYDMVKFFLAESSRLVFDTDRRHQKPSFPLAVEMYVKHVACPGQQEWWHNAARDGFPGVWSAATALPTFGRLSAFSYLEYLRIVDSEMPDASTLFLDDLDGSRSHRNGLAIVLGRDNLDWHRANASFLGVDEMMKASTIHWLREEAGQLLVEAFDRTRGDDSVPEDDVTYFTLESALCTYKSWHRLNRRYPNVYNDMLHDRLLVAQEKWPNEDFGPIWRSREFLPDHLRLERSPRDPGVVPVKQNWYANTGQVLMMHRDWECFANGFNRAIDSDEPIPEVRIYTPRVAP